MVSCKLRIEKFGEMGEKTGWTYIFIPNDIANEINPNVRKSYRVKGNVAHVAITQQSIMPMGEGHFILPLKKEILNKLKMPVGEWVHVTLTLDESKITLDADFVEALSFVESANLVFFSYTPSHQHYFNNYILQAKTIATKTKRIVKIIRCLELGMNFSEMLKDKTIQV